MKRTLHILVLLLLPALLLGQTKTVLKEVTKVSSTLNTDAEESLPLYSPNGRLYFVRTLYDQNVGGELSGQDIWFADLDGNNWTPASNEIYPLNNIFNNGVVGVADSGRTLYLNGSYSSKPEYQYGLSVTNYKDGKWTRPRAVRIKGFNPYSPYLNFYVNDKLGIMVLSFAERKNPMNEDIYVSFRVKENVWSKPESLGPNINTDSAEFSPFLSEDGRTLYFSSNGHGGFGSFDVFTAYRMDETWEMWSTVTNLGQPINSEHFEAYYTQYGLEGYFSSNRDSKMSDLYKAQFEEVKIEKPAEVPVDDRMTKETMFTMRGYLDIRNPQQVKMVRVLDLEGNVVERVKPASDGSFEIHTVDRFSRYSIDLNGQEKEIEGLEIFFVNSDGSRVYLNEGLVSGQYPFETLERDIKAVLMAEVNEDAQNALFRFGSSSDVPAGSSMYLFDAQGRMRETSVVNRKGEFAFKSMVTGDLYHIEMEEGTTITPSTKLYYVTKDEQVEVSGNILKGAVFKKMSRTFEVVKEEDLIAKKPQEKVEDNSQMADGTTFGFDYGQLPPEGTRVTLVDENGNIVEEAFTDAEGLFRFKKLAGDKNYSIKLDEAADTHKDLSMYIVDNDGLQRPLAKSVATGESFSGSVAKGTTAATDEHVFSFNYQALPPAGSKVYLTDENDNIVDSAFVDADGNFKFKKLASDKAYNMRMANDEDLSSGLAYMITDATGNELKLAEGGAIVNAKDEHAFSFNYNTLPPAGSKVYLTDENDHVIDSAYVDNDGNFKFKKLKADKAYNMRMADDKDYSSGLAYMITDAAGNAHKLATKDEKGDAIKVVSNTQKAPKMAGGSNISKFAFDYRNLPNEGTKVYLTDEHGNIVDSSYVDAAGNFRFKKLDPSKTYLFKVDDEEFDISQASLYAVDGGEKRQLKKLPGSFAYNNLAPIAAKDTELDASKFQMEYEGQLPEQAQAYLYDEETNEIVETAEIAPDGSFSFRKLNPDRKYNIKFDEEIDNSKAKYFPVEDEVAAVVSAPTATPTPAKTEQPYALQPPVDKKQRPVPVKKDDVVNKTVFEESRPLSDLNADWVLYFGFNEFLLSKENIAVVKGIAQTLREDETLVIRIDGHADNVGSEEVNYRMSVLRISNVVYHLEIRGVDEKRMELQPFGELKPIADNSTEEGRNKNRRVEIHIEKKKKTN